MMIVLIHDAQNGQMQFGMEGGDPQLGIAMLQQGIATIQQQHGGLVVPTPPPAPPPPRPSGVREVILPKESLPKQQGAL